MLRLVLALTIVASSFIPNCKGVEKGLPPPRATPTAVPQVTLTGEAFLKKVRGTEHLSGVEVFAHDRNFYFDVRGTVKSAEDKSAADRATLAKLDPEIEGIQDQIDRYEDLSTSYKQQVRIVDNWKERIVKAREIAADFKKMGYNSFSCVDHSTGRQIRFQFDEKTTTWQQYISTSRAHLDAIVRKCDTELAAAERHLSSLADSMNAVPIGDLIERLRGLKADRARLDPTPPSTHSVVESMLMSRTPRVSVISDSDGEFLLRLAPGEYTLVATYVDDLDGSKFTWVLPIKLDAAVVPEKIILSQATLFDRETALGLAPN